MVFHGASRMFSPSIPALVVQEGPFSTGFPDQEQKITAHSLAEHSSLLGLFWGKGITHKIRVELRNHVDSCQLSHLCLNWLMKHFVHLGF